MGEPEQLPRTDQGNRPIEHPASKTTAIDRTDRDSFSRAADDCETFASAGREHS